MSDLFTSRTVATSKTSGTVTVRFVPLAPRLSKQDTTGSAVKTTAWRKR